jgi:hypothetical protein
MISILISIIITMSKNVQRIPMNELKEMVENSSTHLNENRYHTNKFDSETFLREIGNEIKEVDEFLCKVENDQNKNSKSYNVNDQN